MICVALIASHRSSYLVENEVKTDVENACVRVKCPIT